MKEKGAFHISQAPTPLKNASRRRYQNINYNSITTPPTTIIYKGYRYGGFYISCPIPRALYLLVDLIFKTAL